MPSKSKSQQRLMGVAYAVKSGDMQLSDVDNNYKDKVKDLVDGMTLKQLKDFAETKHDDLPEEVEEGITAANIGGMGPIKFPSDFEPGSGDVPAGRKSEEEEEDEKQLKENMKGLITSFESFIQEARDMNDPILMKLRADQMKRAAKKDEPKQKQMSPAKAKKLAKLKAQRAEIMRDMEQEAEMEGGPIADRYGDMLNKIDKQIAKLQESTVIEEAYNEEDINMSYGFFGAITDTAKSEKEALKLFDEGVAQLQRAPYRLTEKEALAVLNSKMGRKAADQINDGQADSAVLGLEQYYGKKLKSEIAKVQRAAVSESTEAINEWGSSDQAAMNQSIHQQLGKPRKFMSPFDSKLRAAAEDAVDWYWDEWPEYKRDRAGLIDNAVRSYMRAFFPKEFSAMVRMFEPVDEAYDGNMADFKYEFPQTFVEVTSNPEKAIKKIAKKGKNGYEVRTSIYMSEPEMKAVGDAMGLELVSYEKSSNIAISVYESVEVSEARSINKIQKDWGKVTADMKSTVEAWKAAEGKEKEDLLATLKGLTAQKKKLEAELDDAVGLKDADAELAESLDEARSWGTYGTPEAKKVIKDMDKTWDKFSKTVSKAHADFRSQVKSIINSEDGSKSGITDSEGGAYITGMVEQFVRKEFMLDPNFGDISRHKYMNGMYESNEITEVESLDESINFGDYVFTSRMAFNSFDEALPAKGESVYCVFLHNYVEVNGSGIYFGDNGGGLRPQILGLFTEEADAREMYNNAVKSKKDGNMLSVSMGTLTSKSKFQFNYKETDGYRAKGVVK